MDIFNLIYYGLVCGVLASMAPRLGKKNTRFVIGILVGVVAALLLPQLRALI